MLASMLGIVCFAAAVLVAGLAGRHYYDALAQVRERLPASLQEELRARFAFDTFLWTPSVPESARRAALRSHVFGSLFAVLLTAFLIGRGPAFFIFAAMAVLSIAMTIRFWRRVRRHANASTRAIGP